MPEEEDCHERKQGSCWQKDKARLSKVSAARKIWPRQRIYSIVQPPNYTQHKGSPAEDRTVNATEPNAKHPRDKETLVQQPHAAVCEGAVMIHPELLEKESSTLSSVRNCVIAKSRRPLRFAHEEE